MFIESSSTDSYTRIAIAYLTKDIKNLIHEQERNNDDFIGLAFGKRIKELVNDGDSFYAEHYEGLESPFRPLVFSIEKGKIGGDYKNPDDLGLAPVGLFSVNRSGVFRNEISRDALSDYHGLEFSEHDTFSDFGYALFPTSELYNIIEHSGKFMYLSGALIKFGHGRHNYDSVIGSDVDTQHFTLKLEGDKENTIVMRAVVANSSDRNIKDISIRIDNDRLPGDEPMPEDEPLGEPEVTIGVPCPPHWKTH